MFRQFEIGQLAFECGQQLFWLQLHPGFTQHKRKTDFAKIGMRHTYHRALGHAREIVQSVFNFSRVDVQSAADDQVFAAPHDTHIAFFVQRPHVACHEIAISGELLRGLFWHAPVACKYVWPLHLNAAHLRR